MEIKPTITLPKALPHQLPILRSPARQKVVACGRRWGKTALGLMATVKGHGPQRGVFRGAIDGAEIWWVPPTFAIGMKIWRDLKRALGSVCVSASEMEKRIELPGGGAITVKSADNPESLVGEGLDGLVIDETGFVKKKAWVESLRPALTDKKGWCMAIGTPNGLNWYHDLFKAAGRDENKEAWQRPTIDNPLITQEEMDEALKDMGFRAFRQQHEAEFLSMEGAEFEGTYFGESLWFDEWPADDKIRCRIMALDPSKGKTEKSDYTAFVMMALTWDGMMYVDADIERRDLSVITADAFRLGKDFRPDAFGIESVQFQELLATNIMDYSRAHGMMLPVHLIPNTENKITRIRSTLTPFLSRGGFRFKSGSRGAKMLVDQLVGFPVDKYDDGPDALEMAVRLARHVYEHGAEAVDQPEERVYT